MILEFIDIKDVYYPYDDVIKDYLSRENADIKDYKCKRKNQASPIVIKWKTDIDSVVTQKFIYSLEPDFKKNIQIKVDADKRKDEYIFVDKDTIIEKGDTLTLFGPYKNIKLLFMNDDKEKPE